MNHRRPPLAHLRVFEAAARHLSFTRAATELGVTRARSANVSGGSRIRLTFDCSSG